MLAVQATKTGGPEVLEVVDLPVPEPGPGQIRVRHRAIGLNFIDTYQRSGLYPMRLPAVLGQEAAGLRLPETISFEPAAAALLKGMTAEFLLRRCYPLKAGETIFVPAASGG